MSCYWFSLQKLEKYGKLKVFNQWCQRQQLISFHRTISKSLSDIKNIGFDSHFHVYFFVIENV